MVNLEAGLIGGILAEQHQAKVEEKLKAHMQAQQGKAEERRFNELIARVLNTIHIDRDSYGPLSVGELEKQTEFKNKIQVICKEYL